MNEHAKEKLLQRALSDEEKTASLKNFSNNLDDYSAVFETALEDLQPEPGQFASARSKFFQTQLDSPSDSGTEIEPPDLPDTAPPDLAASAKVDSGFPSVNSIVRLSVDVTKDKSADEEMSDTSLVRARMRLFESNDKPTKSDLHRVSKSVELKPAVPIAKLDEISNFDDQFDNNQGNIKDAVEKMADEKKLDEGTKEGIEDSEEASTSTSNEPVPLITNEYKIAENIEDDNKEAIKTLDDAVDDLMALVRDDDHQNASADNEAYTEHSVVVIDDDPSESNTETKENPVPDHEFEIINVDESKIVLDSTGSSLCNQRIRFWLWIIHRK